MMPAPSRPYLVVVTGRPAAGKTTLASQLARELKLPLVSKDRIREVLFDRLGWQDRAWARLLGRASIDLMFHFAEAQLEAGGSLIMDNSFDPTLSTSRFQDLLQRFDAGLVQIVCRSDAATLFQRFSERAAAGARHPGHGDETVLDELRAHLADEHPLTMELNGPVIEVDTTDFIQVNSRMIAEQVRVAMNGQRVDHDLAARSKP